MSTKCLELLFHDFLEHLMTCTLDLTKQDLNFQATQLVKPSASYRRPSRSITLATALSPDHDQEQIGDMRICRLIFKNLPETTCHNAATLDRVHISAWSLNLYYYYYCYYYYCCYFLRQTILSSINTIPMVRTAVMTLLMLWAGDSYST
jgi:hypothetical protein